MAASTGGPGILAEILSKLPANFPAPILIVQHITPGFGTGLADWLNQQTPLQVRLARHADEPKPGQALIAPDGAHMVVNSLGLIAMSNEPPLHGLRPAADYLFHSAARVYGATAIGVILTGMGSDGAEGLQTMRQVGAHTIVQDKETCVVFGMPAVAIELGAAEQILPAKRIAAAIMALI
jgi:two-component system chemotaxis response regulator CheB